MMSAEVDAVYVESWQRRRDGEKRLLAWWCRNLKDENGKVIGALSTARDITEEYYREEALLMQSQLFDAVQDSIIVHDFDGKFIYLNENAWKSRGYTREEMMGMTLRELDAPEHDGTLPERMKAAIERMRQQGWIKIEVEHRCKNGDRLPVEVYAKLITLRDRQYVLSSVRDISERKAAQYEIERFFKAVEQIDDIVYMTDRAGNITYVNKAFCTHTGYEKSEVIGKNARMSKSGMHDREFYKELWGTIVEGNVYRNTLINRKKNGDIYYEKKTITPLKDEKGIVIGFVSTGKDVTQETMLHQEIERIASTDKLTGIYNRHKFEEVFALESERSRRFSAPLSIILIDIDHFKRVNDHYGHDIGDEVLKRLAEIVQDSIRKIDIFARWGGEEFLILCPGTDREQARQLAEKLRSTVEAVSDFPKIRNITISLGVSTFATEDTFSELFKRADESLYYAKEKGRNRVGAL